MCCVADEGDTAAAPAVGGQRLSLPGEYAVLRHRARIRLPNDVQEGLGVACEHLETPLRTGMDEADTSVRIHFKEMER